ncbi:antibiotic biosynthesis monooxygenase [Paenibacillus tarimensis]
MIVATNTIRIKSGHVAAVAERFKNPKGVQHAPGFIRMELLQSEGEEFDELRVCTTWENREAFDAWVNSDAFKQAHAHARSSGGEGKPSGDGGPQNHGGQAGPQQSGTGIMLGAKLTVHEVVFSTLS